MRIHNNRGELIGEINTIIRPAEGTVIVTNAVYDRDRVVSQTISTRDDAGNAAQEMVFGGKILP